MAIQASQVFVRTLVEPTLQRRMDAALASLSEPVDVAHNDSWSDLYASFPYRGCAIFVAQWSRLVGTAKPEIVGAQTLPELLASWDGVLLLLNGVEDATLPVVLGSPLAARLGIHELERSAGNAPVRPLLLELTRVLHAALSLPPARLLLDRQAESRLLGLPVARQPTLLAALRDIDEWPVKRVSAELGVDRSTLDRSFRRRGLPTLSALQRKALKNRG